MNVTPRFAWVFNLDAEYELARPGYQARQKLTDQLALYGTAARALLGPRDVELAVVPKAVIEPAAFIGRAWCPTPSAVALLERAGATPEPHPAVEVLRRVNHRRFAAELGGGLRAQRWITSDEELDRLLTEAPRRWMLKRPLSFAGRGQLRVSQSLTEKERAWVRASLERDGLIAEPLVIPTLEFSLHGFVEPQGGFELGRACVQDVTERGVYRATRLASPGELTRGEERALFESAERAGSALGAAGYFGPFGIDAYRYRDGEEQGFCALGELNARYTMGFVVGFRRHPSELSLAPFDRSR